MRSIDDFEELEILIAERGQALLATATLLAGGRAAGEDLLQAALKRVMKRWSEVRGQPEVYLRRAMYHLAVDQRRARRRRPEVLGRSVAQLEGRVVEPSSTVVTTASPSYRIKIFNTSRYQGRAQVEVRADCTGVYDPATRTGQGPRRMSPTGRSQFQTLRFIADTFYAQDSQNWRQDQGTMVDALVLDGGRRWGPWAGSSADFGIVLRPLRPAGPSTSPTAPAPVRPSWTNTPSITPSPATTPSPRTG